MAKSTGSARSKLSKYVVEVVEVVELGTDGFLKTKSTLSYNIMSSFEEFPIASYCNILDTHTHTHAQAKFTHLFTAFHSGDFNLDEQSGCRTCVVAYVFMVSHSQSTQSL